MRDAGGQLTEGRELLRLNQSILGGSELFKRVRQFARTGSYVLEQASVLNREHRLRGESLQEVDRRFREHSRLFSADYERADDAVGPQQRNHEKPAVARMQDDIPHRRWRLVGEVGHL